MHGQRQKPKPFRSRHEYSNLGMCTCIGTAGVLFRGHARGCAVSKQRLLGGQALKLGEEDLELGV